MRKPHQIILRFDRTLARLESLVLVIVLGIMVLLAFLQVILRNLFSTGILWADTFLRHLVLWICILGASIATRDNKHINVDVLSRLLRQTWQRWVHFVTNLFSAFITSLLAWAALKFILDEHAAGSTLFLNIPLWLFISILPVGFIIMTFRFLLKTIPPDIFEQPREVVK